MSPTSLARVSVRGLTTAPRGPAGPAPRGPAGRRPATGGGGGAGVEALVTGFVRLFLEVECGRRPAVQLSACMCPRLYAQLAPVWVRPGAPGRILRVIGSFLGAERYEATALVRRDGRVGAVAVALHRRGGRWLVCAAARPEDGPLPEPPWTIPEDEPDAFAAVGEDGAVAGVGPAERGPVS